MSNGGSSDGAGPGDTPVDALDRYIDGLTGRRDPIARQRGDDELPLSTVVDRLATLRAADWERAVPRTAGLDPISPGPVGDLVSSNSRERGPLATGPRLARILVASAAVLAVLAGALVATNLSGQPPSSPNGGATVVPAVWRLAGYIDQPAWEVGGAAGAVGTSAVLACPSSSHCFAVAPTANSGASLFESTRDGGATWQPSKLPAGWQFSSGLSCISTERCVAGGTTGSAPGASTGMGPGAAILTTANGGMSWGAQALPPSIGYLNSVSCAADGHCVGSGFAPEGTGTQGPPIAAAGTVGGAWSVFDLPPQFALDVPGGLFCLTASSCVLVGVDMAPGNPTAAAFYTDDGGLTWSSATVPHGLVIVRAVSCVDATHCLAVANEPASGSATQIGPSEALVTSDGGRTWSATGSLATLALVLTSVSCVSIDNCWAAGQSAVAPAGVVVHTTDGGRSWSAVQLPSYISLGPGTTKPLNLQNVSALSCSADGGCVALGAGNTFDVDITQIVLRSSPGGGA